MLYHFHCNYGGYNAEYYGNCKGYLFLNLTQN